MSFNDTSQTDTNWSVIIIMDVKEQTYCILTTVWFNQLISIKNYIDLIWLLTIFRLFIDWQSWYYNRRIDNQVLIMYTFTHSRRVIVPNLDDNKLCTVFVLEEVLFPKNYARYVDVITFHFSRVPTNLLYPNYSPDYLTPFKINRHITFWKILMSEC